MKRFVRNIGLGLLAFLIFWGIAEWGFYKMQPTNVYSYKYNYVKDNPSIKTLFIGHSHFECGVNTHLMDSAFNFAISGRRWIYWDVEQAKQLVPTMPNLKTIVFPLGYVMPYESFHYDEHIESTKEISYLYTRFMHTWYDRYPGKYLYASAILRNKMGAKYWRDDLVDSLGFDCRVGKSKYFEIDSDFDPEIYNEPKSKLCYQEFLSYLTELAQVCYDNNIRFVVVTTPCADCYVKNTREQGISNLYALVDSVRIHYPVEYYNYIDDAEFREDSLYFNCTHLNSEGADLFTKRLINDINL